MGPHAAELSFLLPRLIDTQSAKEREDWEKKDRAIVASCHPAQRGFVEDPALRLAALVGRGGGKTTGGRARFARRMGRVRRARCLYIAPTRGVAEELMWAPLKELFERLSIEAKFQEAKLKCTILHNGASLYLAGADDKKQIEKYRGQPFHEVGIDECASLSRRILQYLIFRIIGPRLGDYNGVLWLTGTPDHQLFGDFYDITRNGSDQSRPYADRNLPEFEDWAGWSLHKWHLKDAADAGVPAAINLWARALHEKKANAWSDDHPVWRREYMGEWAADDTENIYAYRPHLDDGTPWNQWDPEREDGFAKLPDEFDDWCYAYGGDLGSSDPFGLVIFAWSPTDPSKTLYQVYEYEKRGMHPRPLAELLIGEKLDLESGGGVIGHTGWPESIMFDAAHLGQAFLDELLTVYGIRITPAPRKPNDKHDSIEIFNGDLIDGRVKILKGSKLEEQLSTLQWDIDEFGRMKEPRGQPNDLADAAIYARRGAAHLFAEAAPEPERIIPANPRRADPDHDIKERRKKRRDGDYKNLLADDGYFQDDFPDFDF